jgi:hypothetical protein
VSCLHRHSLTHTHNMIDKVLNTHSLFHPPQHNTNFKISIDNGQKDDELVGKLHSLVYGTEKSHNREFLKCMENAFTENLSYQTRVTQTNTCFNGLKR